MKRILICVCALLVVMTACHRKDKQGAVDTSTSKEEVVKPAFDCDSAFAFVKAQTDFGPRVLGSDAHRQCRDYLVSQLRRFCDTVYVQTFTVRTYDGKQFTAENLVGAIRPDAASRVVLASHWDSRPFADHDPAPARREEAIDGANDGASGVGVLLEVARQLHGQQPAVGIDIVFYDAEDYGPRESDNAPNGEWWGLGSQYWAKNPHVEGYQASYGILLDMVGSPNPKFYQEQFSTHYAPAVVQKVWSTAYSLGYGSHFINQPGGVITDDHYYVNKTAHIPMIDIIHYDMASGTGFDPVWHTTQDNIGHIDKQSLGIVGTTLLQVIKNER
ncbi:MAG: M28 family peptidase [Bacteroidales bacterium]|nr:M28 family peptidase [Bacteroidales bacterium]